MDRATWLPGKTAESAGGSRGFRRRRVLPVVRSMIDDGGWWVVGGWDPGRTRLRRAQEAGRGSCMKLSTDYVEGER